MYKREPILNGYSVDYTPFDYIDYEMDVLEKKFQKINWSEFSNKEKLQSTVSIIQELWQIHCFREGNTRTVALFLYFLLKTIGLHINMEFLGKNAQYFRQALVVASIYSASKPEYLFGIISDSTTARNVTTDKYENLDGFEVNKYTYQNHTVDKIKTMKKI